MKKICLACLVSILFVNVSLSQVAKPNIVKITPFVFLKGQAIEVHYERALLSSFTAGIGLAPIIFAPLFGSSEDGTAKGIAIDPEVRWYANSDKVMDGFFIGLYSSNRFMHWDAHPWGDLWDIDWYLDDPDATENDEYIRYKRKHIVGLQFGTERIFGKGFVFDFYSGIGLNFGSAYTVNQRTKKHTDVTDVAGINIRLNFALGYRF